MWHTWGGQYELYKFLLDFDQWLHLSDTLKRATRSKSDVASVWPMQCAWMISRHGENDCYWCVVEMQEVGINCCELLKTCHHTQVDSFVTSCGCAQSKGAIQDHWLIDYSKVFAFGAYAIVTKTQSVQVGTMQQSIRRARGQARMWIHLYSLHHRIRAIVQIEDSHMTYQKSYCHIVSLVTYPRIYPYAHILILSYP